MRQLAPGPTLLAGDHIREGVMVKPAIERTHPDVGRVALKYNGGKYLFSKSAERDTRDV